MSEQENGTRRQAVGWWQPVLFAALAGGMAWGIRGQYGHETGAMIAGLLVSLTLVLLLCPKARSREVVRAVAWATVGMGIGGSMTYGQTLGLTHDPDLVGNWAALRWGLLGCAIKGGLWIGFAGFFLGLGLGGVRHRPGQLALLMLALVVAFIVGVWFFNRPFDPAGKALPSLYFSDHWYWEPGKELEPRHEWWGGLLLALATAVAYARWVRQDALARRMTVWGILGGALGFPLGQCIQAYHAWNPEVFQQGIWLNLAPHMNWWNWMETTFGTVMGAVLGLGLWLNRRRILPVAEREEDRLPPLFACTLLAVHLVLLFLVEFRSVLVVDIVYDMGIVMAFIPVVCIAGGRWWPYAVALPITVLPIAGKTLRQLVYRDEAMGFVAGSAVYAIVPLAVMTAAAVWFYREAQAGQSARAFARRALLLSAWMYFLLNYAFFRFPWPWAEWTGRTPNAIWFTVCVVGLTVVALATREGKSEEQGLKI